MNESMNDEAVYRTAPATPGLLNTFYSDLAEEAGIARILLARDARSQELKRPLFFFIYQ